MPDILKRALNSRVAPGRILLGHPHHEALNLGEHAATARWRPDVRPFASDELPMPAQQRVRSDNRGDLAQPSTAYASRAGGESPSVIVGQLQAVAPQLATQEAVLFDQIAEHPVLLALQPPCENGEHQLEGGGVDHSLESRSWTRIRALAAVDPAVGHYGSATGPLPSPRNQPEVGAVHASPSEQPPGPEFSGRSSLMP